MYIYILIYARALFLYCKNINLQLHINKHTRRHINAITNYNYKLQLD